jgi:signal transduction histidine kinase
MRRMQRDGCGQRTWLVLIIVVTGVMAPTAGVLWFMSQAMQNERLAVRQRLADAYQPQLQLAAARVNDFWKNKLSALSRADGRTNGASAFADLVKNGAADSVLLYDQQGNLIYPDLSHGLTLGPAPMGSEWLRARQLEFESNRPQVAADIYSQIVRKATDSTEVAQAMQSQARCIYKAGSPQAALQALTSLFNAPRYRTALDEQGRLIAPNSELFAIRILKELAHPDIGRLEAKLSDELNNYRIPMPASQRVFLMRQLKTLWPECPDFPTLDAEELAAAYWEKRGPAFRPGQLQLTVLSEIWVTEAADGKVVALFRQRRLVAAMDSALGVASQGITLSLLPPGTSHTGRTPFLTASLEDLLPSWRVVLYLDGPDPFAAASSRRTTIYLWTGIIVTAAIALLALLLAAYLRHQIHVTRLKNDLIATVSHELKTPLSSIRVLIDTLLDGQHQNSQQVFEYLQLIAKENSRLSNLIDNFLTFSRMERGKFTVEMSKVKVEEIIDTAVQTLEDRLQAPGCALEVDLAHFLSPVTGDRESLVTVLVNLLDNALKYTGPSKHIALRCFSANGDICIEVSDDGIGFSRRAAKRIFDRFFQVDRSLTRRVGGCGLGLSIVKSIVAAHNGTVSAQSQVGKGSTFTVRLPAN